MSLVYGKVKFSRPRNDYREAALPNVLALNRGSVQFRAFVQLTRYGTATVYFDLSKHHCSSYNNIETGQHLILLPTFIFKE